MEVAARASLAVAADLLIPEERLSEPQGGLAILDEPFEGARVLEADHLERSRAFACELASVAGRGVIRRSVEGERIALHGRIASDVLSLSRCASDCQEREQRDDGRARHEDVAHSRCLRRKDHLTLMRVTDTTSAVGAAQQGAHRNEGAMHPKFGARSDDAGFKPVLAGGEVGPRSARSSGPGRG